MKLIPNAREVIKRAWSVWAFYAIAGVEALQTIWPYFNEDVPKLKFALVQIGLAFLGVTLRLIKQGNIPDESA